MMTKPRSAIAHRAGSSGPRVAGSSDTAGGAGHVLPRAGIPASGVWLLPMAVMLAATLVVLLARPLPSRGQDEDEGYSVVTVEEGGTISGRVAFTTDEYPQPEKIRTDRDADTCGISVKSEEFVVDEESGGLKNAIVFLDGITEGKAFPEDATAVVHQQGCRYDPHITIGYVGHPLYIENDDPVLHNVHAYKPDRSTVFNIAQATQHQRNKMSRLRAPGIYNLKCDVHSWMNAFVVVAETPYVAVTDEKGRFTIDDVPPGDYEVRIWHEGVGEGTKPVTVEAGKTSSVEFLIGGEG